MILVDLFYIDYFVPCRVSHLPPVAGFCRVITGIIRRIGEGLRTKRLYILLKSTQGVIMHKLVLFQLLAYGFIEQIPQLR